MVTEVVVTGVLSEDDKLVVRVPEVGISEPWKLVVETEGDQVSSGLVLRFGWEDRVWGVVVAIPGLEDDTAVLALSGLGVDTDVLAVSGIGVDTDVVVGPWQWLTLQHSTRIM